ESLANVLRTFDPTAYAPTTLRAHAERFRPERFIERLRAIVDETLNARRTTVTSNPDNRKTSGR
ncbi:MAG TPA: hypothetical protein VK665_08570, partial [Candidatus Elarobacter sp.]|nr:hypothetical protein [Candidatus Elarobacter sp.]